MHFSTFVYTLSMMSSAGLAQYVLEDDYFANGDFYSMFSFWNSSDPTDGFVDYYAESGAASAGLIQQSSNNAQWGVDHSNITPNGRPAVRLTSNKSYNTGLVILDVDHMPGGICGTWPAFWMVGPNWPYDGEIDIIEGVNEQNQNDMTLHTGPSCTISNNGGFTGSMTSTYCNSADGDNNGCQIQDPSTNSYGAGFNANNGGVYATEITGSAISIWFFPRNSIPADISNNSPNPSNWGTPLSMFSGSSCDISSNFQQLQIVFDTTFCGQWAGNVWGSSSCASQAPSCNAFVQNNPSAFTDAFWSVNGLKVYQPGNSNVNTPPAVVTTAAPSSTAAPIPITTTFATIATSAYGGWSPVVTGTGPIGEEPFNPAPTPTVAPDSPENAVAPSSAPAPAPTPTPTTAAEPSNGVWAPTAGSGGVLTEGFEPSRRARRARHVRAHRARHDRFARR